MESTLKSISLLIEKYPFSKTIAISVLLLVFMYVFRIMIFSRIDGGKNRKNEKMLLKKSAGRYLSYFTLLVLFLLWFSQLQVFFVSLLAVAAAIVLAFKEVIMCITGGLLVRISKPFSVGQRIQISTFRGFVVETSLLTTKVLEIGPEKNSQQTTGDIISIPNSLMLSNPVKNESYFKGYSIKSYIFRTDIISEVESLEEKLIEKAKNLCSSYILDAEKSISSFCEKEGIAIPSVEPRTKIILDDDKDEVTILIKMPVQNSSIGDVEQELNRFFLHWKIDYLKNNDQSVTTLK